MVDKVSGTISLLRGNNYDMIASLLEESYLTCDILMAAIHDHRPDSEGNIIATMDLLNAHGALDATRDQKFIQYMMDNVVVLCSPDNVRLNDIFMQLTDAGGVLQLIYCLFRTNDSAFEHYVTTQDIIDDPYLVQCSMNINDPHVNPRMCNWIYNRWISRANSHSFIDSCQIVLSASYDGEHFREAFDRVATSENIERLRLYLVHRCIRPKYLPEMLTGSEYYDDFMMLCVIDNVYRTRAYGVRPHSAHLAFDPVMLESFMKDDDVMNICTNLLELWCKSNVCAVFCEIMDLVSSLRYQCNNYLNSQ